MYTKVLLALDLEGVNNVVGEPYKGLERDTEQWKIACLQAVSEINAAAEALFEIGVEKVGLWDNHGGGNNIDVSLLDPRITYIQAPSIPRMRFADGKYDCICYFGYHAMEGTLGGVLAHTMSSKTVQYYKLNGKYIGEIDMDAYIAAEMGIPSVFFCGGDIACAQARRTVSDIVTVDTKKELSRNSAIFRDNEDLLSNIRHNIVKAVMKKHSAPSLTFPAIMEKSFKRVEDANKYYLSLVNKGICAEYPDDEVLGKDAHTVVSAVRDIEEFILSI